MAMLPNSVLPNYCNKTSALKPTPRLLQHTLRKITLHFQVSSSRRNNSNSNNSAP